MGTLKFNSLISLTKTDTGSFRAHAILPNGQAMVFEQVTTFLKGLNFSTDIKRVTFKRKNGIGTFDKWFILNRSFDIEVGQTGVRTGKVISATAHVIKCRANNVDCTLERSRPVRLVWADEKGWNRDYASREFFFRCVQIGAREQKYSDVLVEVNVSIVLDTSPIVTKESHIARFLPDDWDVIVNSVSEDHDVVLKNSRIVYDDKKRSEGIDTMEHWDFANPDGSITGNDIEAYKKYIPGWVVSCGSVILSKEVNFGELQKPVENIGLPSFLELLEEWRHRNRDKHMQMPRSQATYFDDSCNGLPESVVKVKSTEGCLSAVEAVRIGLLDPSDIDVIN